MAAVTVVVQLGAGLVAGPGEGVTTTGGSCNSVVGGWLASGRGGGKMVLITICPGEVALVGGAELTCIG